MSKPQADIAPSPLQKKTKVLLAIAIGLVVLVWLAFLLIALRPDLFFDVVSLRLPDGVASESLLARRGQLGDSFGIFNALISGLGLVGLVTTVFLQRSIYEEQWKQTKAQISLQKHQQFHAQFESAVAAYDSLLASIVVSREGDNRIISSISRQALMQIWRHNFIHSLAQRESGEELYALLSKYHSGRAQVSSFFSATVSGTAALEKIIAAAQSLKPEECLPQIYWAWSLAYSQHEYQLDALFRAWYHVYSLIDRAGEYDVQAKAQWEYASGFRARLSWIEMLFLLVNQTTWVDGSKFPKAAALSNKFAVFDNLNPSSDPIAAILYKRAQAGNNFFSELTLSAFSSKIAHMTNPPYEFYPPSGIM